MFAAARDTNRSSIHLIACIAIALLVGCSKSPPYSLKPAAGGRTSVAVADFDFFSNDKSLSYLQQGVPAMMCTDISQVRALDVLARKTMLSEIRKEQQLAEDGLIDKATAARAGKLLGATFLLGGAVHAEENRLRLDAQVVDVETGRVFFSTTVSGAKDEASALEAQLAEQVAESMCGSLGMELSERERLAVRGERKGGFDSFALYSKAAIAERAGENEKARLIFKEVMARHSDDKDQANTVAGTLRAATNTAPLATSVDAKETTSRLSRLKLHKAKWEAIDTGASRDPRWLASPIILSAHAGLANDYALEWQLLDDYWRRFTKHVSPSDAISTANDIAGIIRVEEEFFRAQVDSGVYSGEFTGSARRVHADCEGVTWPWFSRLWPFDSTLREMKEQANYAYGDVANLIQSSFMGRLPKLPHDYLEHAMELDDTPPPNKELALRADVIGYCGQIPNPPEKMVSDIHKLHYGFLHGLDKMPTAVDRNLLGGEFVSRVVPVLDALSKTAPERDHRDLATRLLTRLGRQIALAGSKGADVPTDSQQSVGLFGVPVTTNRVLIVWHEDQLVDLVGASKQEAMTRIELADLIRSLPGSTSINFLLAFGNVVPPSLPAKDQWIFEKPIAASPDTKKRFLEALDPEINARQVAKSTLSAAIKEAFDMSAGRDTTIIIVRLRDESTIDGALDLSLFEQRTGVALHAVMSKESPQLAELVRHYRGAMILLESDGNLVSGKVQKRVIDTAKD
jgi:TolB-like protein